MGFRAHIQCQGTGDNFVAAILFICTLLEIQHTAQKCCLPCPKSKQITENITKPILYQKSAKSKISEGSVDEECVTKHLASERKIKAEVEVKEEKDEGMVVHPVFDYCA